MRDQMAKNQRIKEQMDSSFEAEQAHAAHQRKICGHARHAKPEGPERAAKGELRRDGPRRAPSHSGVQAHASKSLAHQTKSAAQISSYADIFKRQPQESQGKDGFKEYRELFTVKKGRNLDHRMSQNL